MNATGPSSRLVCNSNGVSNSPDALTKSCANQRTVGRGPQLARRESNSVVPVRSLAGTACQLLS